MKITKILTAVLVLLAAISVANAQERYYVPLGRMYDLDMQASVAADTADKVLFTAVKPVLVPTDEPLPIAKPELSTAQWLKRHFFDDDFLQFSSDIHAITINPIFHFQRTYVRTDKEAELAYFKRQ